jgi:hypothetical protein
MVKESQTEGQDRGSRRRAPRLKVSLPGRLAGRQTHAVTIVDISQSGCLIQCPAALDLGSILDLAVDLGGGTVSVKVQVAEASLDGDAGAEGPAVFLTGLEFLGLSARAEAQLRRFLGDEARRRRGADSAPR